jgi:hypothetical protein
MKTQATPTTATVSATKSPKATICDKSSKDYRIPAGFLQGHSIRARPVHPEEEKERRVIV